MDGKEVEIRMEAGTNTIMIPSIIDRRVQNGGTYVLSSPYFSKSVAVGASRCDLHQI